MQNFFAITIIEYFLKQTSKYHLTPYFVLSLLLSYICLQRSQEGMKGIITLSLSVR